MSDIPAIKILLDLKVGMKNRALYKEMHENSFYTTKGESAKYWYKDNYKLIDRYINVIIKNQSDISVLVHKTFIL